MDNKFPSLNSFQKKELIEQIGNKLILLSDCSERIIAHLDVLKDESDVGYRDFLFIISRALKRVGFLNDYMSYMQKEFLQKYSEDPMLAFYYADSLFANNEQDALHDFVCKLFDEIDSQWIKLELAEILCDAHLWKLVGEKFCSLSFSGNASKLKYNKIKKRIDLSEKFDCKPDIDIFYINLDKDSSKRKRIERQLSFASVNYHRVPGILAKKLPLFVKNKLHRSHVFKVQEGALGCFLAHISALEMVVEKNIEVALILEDDAYFYYRPSSFVINHILKNDFDLIYVNSRMMDMDQNWDEPLRADSIATRIASMPDVISGWGGDGYIVTNAGARKLLENFSNDLGLGHFDGQLGSYGLIGVDFTPRNKAQKTGASLVSRFSKRSKFVKSGCLRFPLISFKEYGGSSRVSNS